MKDSKMDKPIDDANSIINTAVTSETIKQFACIIAGFYQGLILNGLPESHALILTSEYVRGIASNRPAKS